MKTHVKATLAISVATLFGLSDQTQAATISWGSVTAIASESDVSLAGTLILARQATNNANQTVNGVLFDGVNNTQNSVTFGLPSGWGGYDANSYVAGLPDTPGSLSSAYQNMLTGAWYKDGANTSTISLSGLTTGQQYQVQVWVADYREFPPSVFARSETLTAGNTSGALTFLQTDGSGNSLGSASGSYILGTFTADGSGIQNIDVTSTTSVHLNAFQLRAIPEPSAALLGGLGMLALLRRRR